MKISPIKQLRFKMGVIVICMITLIITIPLAHAGLFGGTSSQDIKQKYNVSDFCSGYEPYHNQSVDCQTLANTVEIIKQNKIIIQQNAQNLKNQEIIKCYILHKNTRDYHGDVSWDADLANSPTKLIGKCGK